MPIPHPAGKEKHDKFISKCMGDSVMNKDYPDQKQRYAICESQWKKSKKHSKGNVDPDWEDQSNDDYTILY